MSESAVDVTGVNMVFNPGRANQVRALEDVSLSLRPGEFVNSSRPTLRCAFCIGILLGKHGGSAVCEDQGQALGEPFALSDRGHLLVIGLFEAVHDFAGFPTRDVAHLTRSKYPIEQT